MEHGMTELRAVLDELAGVQTLGVRLALRSSGGLWRLEVMRADAVPDKSLAERTWSYAGLLLLAGPLPGSVLGGWLRDLTGTMGGFDFLIPSLQDQVSWTTYPSLATNVWDPSPWPFIQYEVRCANSAGQRLPQNLGLLGFPWVTERR